jgi:hypothetical protein
MMPLHVSHISNAPTINVTAANPTGWWINPFLNIVSTPLFVSA